MAFDPREYDDALDRASTHARQWLSSLPERAIPMQLNADEVGKAFSETLQDGPIDPAAVIDELAEVAEPGLMAMASGRFFGWVIGGTLPAALAADWLVSAWDQNTGMRFATPGVVAAEETAARWLLDLLGLPAAADVGFVTGATMANFTGLIAGRQALMNNAGWDLARLGLNGAPRINVIAGAERHDSIDLALRYLGLGEPALVAADEQGRIRLDALAEVLDATTGSVLLCLQAGNLHSGAFDPIGEATALARAYAGDAWVHVDGAFGLFAAASPSLSPQLNGYEAADSWATDAHKTLNVPYDCGIAIVNSPAALREAVGAHTSYLINPDVGGPGDPLEKVPEFSRRARGVTVWAALRSLGRSGVADLVDTFTSNAQAIAAGIAEIPGAEILNDVNFTQISVAFGDDERTRAITAQVLADGVVWMSGSRWHGRDILRVSVCNWSTDDADVAVAIDAVRRAVDAI